MNINMKTKSLALSWRFVGDLLVEMLEQNLPKKFPEESRALLKDTIQQMARLADMHVETVSEREDTA